jgi:pyrroloquinoline quinone biosynthesis protein B
MIDATSAFEEQNHLLWSAADGEHDLRWYGPPDAVLITHAHTGHYAGLWQLDRSVLAARQVPVYGPPRTIALLARNEPWATMEREGFIALEALRLDYPHELVPGLQVTVLDVPHRAEWGTDTVAARVSGPHATVLYLPDIDQWHAWERDVAAEVAAVDVAFLDGTFWDRPTSPNVPHPPVVETLERLGDLARGGKRVSFTHLNHSNPLVDRESAESQSLLRLGFGIAAEGERVRLDGRQAAL